MIRLHSSVRFYYPKHISKLDVLESYKSMFLNQEFPPKLYERSPETGDWVEAEVDTSNLLKNEKET